MKVHLNGRLMAASDARIDPADRGFQLGDGVFETIAVRGGQTARLAAHLARLRAGAHVLGIEIAADDGALARALADVMEANVISEGVLRLTLTRGPASRGLVPADVGPPTLLITGTAQALTPPRPASAVIATVTRRNEHSPIARIKSTSYLDGILAAREAAEMGADEALLLNTAGAIAEAAAANVFVVLAGRAVTPPISDGALPGVMRADVIEASGAMERTLRPEDLSTASEAFLTNSLGIRPLVNVDGHAVGDGEPGPVCRDLQRIV